MPQLLVEAMRADEYAFKPSIWSVCGEWLELKTLG
jgi:hypothetical protein